MFDAGDVTRGAAVAVLSHSLWQQQFGGRAVTLDGVIPRRDAKSYTVIGVVSASFQFPFADSPWQLWMPMPAGGSGLGSDCGAPGRATHPLPTAAAEAAAIIPGVRGHPEAAAPSQAATPPRFEFVRRQDEVVAPSIGIAVGVGGAAGLTRYLATMLFGLTPLDPITFVAVSVLFAAVAALASWMPARRATAVDPMMALRCD